MGATETIFVIVAALLMFMVVGNLVFSLLAERRNPPIGAFLQCEVYVSTTSNGGTGRPHCPLRRLVPRQRIDASGPHDQRAC
jgi:hypothetical protein